MGLRGQMGVRFLLPENQGVAHAQTVTQEQDHRK